ncbi:hypothetical protein GCK32_000666 [Trichostrongylus colubriformis]|uniref:Uncharacterized protein n=1 Tax=Trichostrongylus colubriformis TaxID=6319 RepID=A0AAN8J2B2_TRICO
MLLDISTVRPVDPKMPCRVFVALLSIAAVLDASIIRNKRHLPSSSVPLSYNQQYHIRQIRNVGTTYGSSYGHTSQGIPRSWSQTVYSSYSNSNPMRSYRTYSSSGLTTDNCLSCSFSHFPPYHSESSTASSASAYYTDGRQKLQTSSSNALPNLRESSLSCTSCVYGTGSGIPTSNPALSPEGYFFSSAHSSHSSMSSNMFSSSWSNSYSSYSKSSSDQADFRDSNAYSSDSRSSSFDGGSPNIRIQDYNDIPTLQSAARVSLTGCTTCSKVDDSSDMANVEKTSSGQSMDSSQGSTITELRRGSSSYGRPPNIEQRQQTGFKTIDQPPPLPPTDEQLISSGCSTCSTEASSSFQSYEKPSAQGENSEKSFAGSTDFNQRATNALIQTEVKPAAKEWEYFYRRFKAFT